MTFDSYAWYYDLFYQEKDYSGEVAFLEKIGEFPPGCSILDVGCGTGGHAIPLAERGYQVTGVDLSENMVGQAREKGRRKGVKATFLREDARTAQLGRMFDRVISMFAVMGYQISNDDLFSAMSVARNHLNPAGLFIFDAWFGPAVLRARPETRVREIANGTERVIRIAVPELNSLTNTVIVHYTIIRLAGGQVLDETRESHQMRFLFAPEVDFIAQKCGFTVLKICPFLEPGREPTDHDWNVTWVLKAV